ncbi:MAG: flippase-like domain-containing protein, partial [Solirubrobacterales bacterium]
FELLSGISYVVMFRPIFCRHMPWQTSWEISWSSLGMGSIVPASGAAGLALGAWILHQGGMPAERIARRSVAFFLLKSSVNFAAVAILGTLMAIGILGPHRSLLLTAVPAVAATAVIGLILALPRLGPGSGAPPNAGRVRRGLAGARKALIGGIAEAVGILRSRDRQVIAGSIGYWAFDNAVLWATFRAFDSSPAISIILMAYLIGQLGGLLPVPGGIGGIDGGLFGALVVYGAPVATTAAAVLAYRVILFWVPLLIGAVAFASLRRGLNDPDRPDLCAVPAAS